LLSHGAKIADVVKAIEIDEVMHYRWRKEYGGLKVSQVKRPRELEKENSRLREAVSDLTLGKMILQGGPGETSEPRTSPRLRSARL